MKKNTKVIAALLIGAGVLMSNKGKEQPPQTPPLPPTNTGYNPPDIPDNVPTLDPSAGTQLESEVAGIENGGIDYRTWRRRDWVRYFRALIQQKGGKAAMQQIWQDWYQPDNKIRNLFPKPVQLIFALAMPVQPATVEGIGTGFNVQWNSVPVYHPGIVGYWSGDEEFWDCQDWITWHQKLEAHYNSTAIANQKWLEAWRDDRNWTQESSTLYWLMPSFLLPPAANCPTDGNCWFIEYLYSKGIDVGTLFGSVSCDLNNTVQNIVGSVENITSGIENTTKVASYALPIAVAVGAGVYINKQRKNGKAKK